FIGHMVLPYNHSLGYREFVMEVSCVHIISFLSVTWFFHTIIPLGIESSLWKFHVFILLFFICHPG
ncbi:hypothetical protein, partial [Mariniflexile sp.]|uniref:hypothetical protein n=1 Tax=Mariniflexile sp. TaxID=1979402 RepID=UPI004048A1FB